MKKIIIPTLCSLLITACSGGGYEYDASGVFEAVEVTVAAKAQGEIISLSIEEPRSVLSPYVHWLCVVLLPQSDCLCQDVGYRLPACSILTVHV